jgi:hypothetical protein
MAVTQYTVSLVTTGATLVTPAATGVAHPVIPGQLVYPWSFASLTIQNTHATATIYLGTSAVTSSSFGVSLLAGTSITIDGLLPTETLYAITSATSSLSILGVIR